MVECGVVGVQARLGLSIRIEWENLEVILKGLCVVAVTCCGLCSVDFFIHLRQVTSKFCPRFASQVERENCGVVFSSICVASPFARP